MIYVTGDMHGPAGLARLKEWGDGREGDFLIVAGDFGYPWDFSEEECDEIAWLESLPYTLLFIDGNHERFDHWESRPVEPWCGGLIQRLRDSSPIIRLMRSEVYVIDGIRIFTLGGAASIDFAYRVPFVSWWPQEVPSERNFDEARANLGACGWEVDYVITHTCPGSLIERTIYPARPIPGLSDERLRQFLDEVDFRLDFKHWYFGHFHGDRDVDERHTLLYESIIPLAGDGEIEPVGMRRPARSRLVE